MNAKKLIKSIVKGENYSNLDDDDDGVSDSFENPSSIDVPNSYQNQMTGGFQSNGRKKHPLKTSQGRLLFPLIFINF